MPDKMSASAVQRCRADYEEERVAFERLTASINVIRNRCSHVWDDGTSALGRGDGMGACERLCTACGHWVET